VRARVKQRGGDSESTSENENESESASENESESESENESEREWDEREREGEQERERKREREGERESKRDNTKERERRGRGERASVRINHLSTYLRLSLPQISPTALQLPSHCKSMCAQVHTIPLIDSINNEKEEVFLQEKKKPFSKRLCLRHCI